MLFLQAMGLHFNKEKLQSEGRKERKEEEREEGKKERKEKENPPDKFVAEICFNVVISSCSPF